MDLHKLSITEYVDLIKSKKISVFDAVKQFTDKAAKDKHNAVLEVFSSWMDKAKSLDERIANDEKVGKFAGVPVFIKDNILYKGHKSSASSNILKDFVSPYSSTVVSKLLKEDAIIIGRTNMDEFAMGNSGESSRTGAIKNAVDTTRIAGGSSGGAAVALKLGYCLISIGSDTGGSVRQPASINGVFGIKPTYGSVSRYGVIAYASSIEQVGVFANTVGDTKLALKAISGNDPMDATTHIEPQEKPSKKPKLGYISELHYSYIGSKHSATYESAFEKLTTIYGEITPISIPGLADKALAVYYIMAFIESSSNLARYDGVRYTNISTPKNNNEERSFVELMSDTRTELLGKEAKRRILLGNYLMSRGHSLADLYNKAISYQQELRKSFKKAMESVDAIILPVTHGPAQKIGEITDPVAGYLEDLFTVPANLLHIPAMSVPFGTAEGLPMGVQLLGDKNTENMLFEIAEKLMEGV